jgi:hypothetical protein
MSESEKMQQIQDLQQTVQQLEHRVDIIQPRAIPWYQRLIAIPCIFVFFTGEQFIIIGNHRLAWIYATSFGFLGLKLVSDDEIEKWIGLSMFLQVLVITNVVSLHESRIGWCISAFYSYLYATFWSEISLVCSAMIYLQIIQLMYDADFQIPNLFLVLPVPAIQSFTSLIALSVSGELPMWMACVLCCIIPPVLFTLPRKYYEINIVAMMLIAIRMCGLYDFRPIQYPRAWTIRYAFLCTTCLLTFLKIYG